MKNIFIVFFFLFPLISFSQSSMRRCTLLPITDSVGGAIGFKVFEMVEQELKRGNWCTYVSNSNLINIFSRYRDNLPQYLKKREVLATVAEKLKVGSLILINLKHEIDGVDVEMSVFGDNGEDLYFLEKSFILKDQVELIFETVKGWLDIYSKTIPYDAKINGVLGDQITLDVGKGYPIKVGQTFLIKRPTQKKKHPLLKKIVDWEALVLGQGSVYNISDNQALGVVSSYRSDKKIEVGDWIRLEELKEIEISKNKIENLEDESSPGTLGILSMALFGSSSSLDTASSTDSLRMSGNLFGVNLRAEGWITREYFASIELERSLGVLKKSAGDPTKSKTNVNNSMMKFTGGYKYLPVGFFFGPQIDFYTGYVKNSFDLDVSAQDGFGKNSISGLLLGTAANIPLTREYRIFAKAELIPFPTFSEEDDIYGTASSATSMNLALGLKFQYRPRITLDGIIETLSHKAKFSGTLKEISYKDNRMKLGMSFNF